MFETIKIINGGCKTQCPRSYAGQNTLGYGTLYHSHSIQVETGNNFVMNDPIKKRKIRVYLFWYNCTYEVLSALTNRFPRYKHPCWLNPIFTKSDTVSPKAINTSTSGQSIVHQISTSHVKRFLRCRNRNKMLRTDRWRGQNQHDSSTSSMLWPRWNKIKENKTYSFTDR